MQNPSSGQSAVYLDILRGLEDSISDDQNLMIGTNFREFHSFGLQTRIRATQQTQKLKNRLEFGVRLHGDDVLRIHTEHPHRMEQGTLVPTDTTLTQLDSKANAFAIAAHIHNDLGVGPLRFVPGLRMESIRSRYQKKEENTAPWLHRTDFLPGLE